MQGGYGAMFEGCGEGGLGVLSTYGASTGADASTSETLLVKTDADLKLGIGYRIAKIDPSSAVDTTTGVDIRFGVDIGQFDHVEYHSDAGDADGAIQPAMKSMHYAFALSVGYHFTP